MLLALQPLTNNARKQSHNFLNNMAQLLWQILLAACFGISPTLAIQTCLLLNLTCNLCTD
jgi:hypothetical protein